MNRRVLVTLGSGAVASGHVGAVATLTGGPLGVVAATAALAGAIGAAAGYRFLTDERLAAFAGRKRLILLSAVGLLALIGWSAWEGWQTDLASRYAVTMAGIYLALVGWITLVQVGQNAESDAARERGETLVTLPTTDLVGILGLERYRRSVTVLGWATGVLTVGWFGWLAFSASNPLFLVFVVPMALAFYPRMTFTVHVTERGLVSENRLGSSVPIGTKLTAWDEVSDYSVDDGTLTIGTQMGVNFSYDIDDIDDREHVLRALDDYVTE